MTALVILSLGLMAGPALAQRVPGASLMSSSNLQLATTYSGNSFFDGFNFFTANDPTGGYVNYLSYGAATSQGLASVVNGAVVMRADAENQASGRGRDSVRISSKSQWADGVYILDLNHMPVGCGTWPAFWTVVENGWPTGGEIDVIEGVNALPARNGPAWNATLPSDPSNTNLINQDIASLHIAGQCTLTSQYQMGTLEATTCNANINGNTGCGVAMGPSNVYGVDSFGAGFNANGGGWYALWRDFANSGGAYVYYWPRNSPHVPDDVKNPGSVVNTTNWGQPGANLSIPDCKSDFGNHVIVFNIDFCGAYAGPTFASAGCPSNCVSFVMNNPKAFSEAYWSINALRVYNASGKPVSTGLSAGAIAGIVIGSVAGLLLLVGGWWLWRRRRNARRAAGGEIALSRSDSPNPRAQGFLPVTSSSSSSKVGLHDSQTPPLHGGPSGNAFVGHLPGDATPRSRGKKTFGINLIPKAPKGNIQANGLAREGKTILAPGRSAKHYLTGETPVTRDTQGQVQDEGMTVDLDDEVEPLRRGSFAGSGSGSGFGTPSGPVSRKGSVAALAAANASTARRESYGAPSSPSGLASRKGSLALPGTGSGGADWVALASGGRRGSQTPSQSRGWVG